jgi:hypothetical protein
MASARLMTWRLDDSRELRGMSVDISRLQPINSEMASAPHQSAQAKCRPVRRGGNRRLLMK